MKQTPKLLNKNGQPKSLTENAKAQLAKDAGDAIFARLSFDTPSKDGASSGESVLDSEDSYTKALIVKAAQEFERIADLIEHLEGRKKKYLAAAKGILAIYLEPFQDWAKGFIPENQTLKYIDSDGNEVNLKDAKLAVSRTCDRWLLNLAKLSNNALKGKPADGDKPPKPSMFDTASKGKRLEGFTLSNTELVKGKAAIAFTAEDGDGKIRAAILEIADAASLFNRDKRAKAGEIVKRLTDFEWDKRFGLDDGLVSELIQLRIYGLQWSACDQAIKEAKEKQENFLKAISSRAALKAESDRMLLNLKADKDFKKEHSGIGGTSVEPTLESPKANLTDPKLNGEVSKPMAAITWQDRAIKRIHKAAFNVYPDITDVELDSLTKECFDVMKGSAEEDFDFADPTNFDHAFDLEYLEEWFEAKAERNAESRDIETERYVDHIHSIAETVNA